MSAKSEGNLGAKFFKMSPYSLSWAAMLSQFARSRASLSLCQANCTSCVAFRHSPEFAATQVATQIELVVSHWPLLADLCATQIAFVVDGLLLPALPVPPWPSLPSVNVRRLLSLLSASVLPSFLSPTASVLLCHLLSAASAQLPIASVRVCFGLLDSGIITAALGSLTSK